MTATETPGYPPAPAPADKRVLRRSREGRVGAGVASGLGAYFGFDPVLFRVLFATSAFFGGAGVIAYLLAWAAIPEEGTERAPIDGWAASLRRRRVPLWAVAGVAGLLLWLTAFSWWAPGPFLPVLAVVVVLVVAFGRRDWQAGAAPSRVDLTKPDMTKPDLTKAADRPSPTATDQSTWVGDLRSWAAEAKAAGRIRRRRTLPIRVGTLGVLAAALIVLGIIDAVAGLALPVYFWVALGVVGAGLLVGLVTRRTPWSLTPLLVPAVVGLVAFAGTHASLHDGIGQRDWRPSSTTHYRLAFGQATLNLSGLTGVAGPTRIDVTVAAGQVHIIAPKTLPVTVVANVHLGRVTVDGARAGADDHGVTLRRVVNPAATATGSPVIVDVHLADGLVSVEHR